MKTFLLTTAALVGLGLGPALAMSCCGGDSAGGQGAMMCGKPAKMDMKAEAGPATIKPGAAAKAGGCCCCGQMAMGGHEGHGSEGSDPKPMTPKP